ncbi:MAG: 4Fe-4S dicluster domain-containing protein [Desulfovibrionaceae bacterium]
MPKAFFIDTTKCTACRGCQIACKEWKELAPNATLQQGSHQNPPDLNYNNYKIVRFSEFKEADGTVRWNFFPDQCRHCVDAPCVLTAQGHVDGAFVKDAATGAVYCTNLTKKLSKDAFEDIRSACPFDIPRRDAATGLVNKCNMCLERVQKDMLPMCVKTCCTGAMNFGERADMAAMAKARLAVVAQEFPEATLNDVDFVSTIYLMAFKPERYWKNAVAQAPAPMSRKQFLARLTAPVRNTARG